MTDLAELIAACRSGDSRAFNELVQRFQDMAFAVAFADSGDTHASHDACQEAFLATFRELEAGRLTRAGVHVIAIAPEEAQTWMDRCQSLMKGADRI